MPPSEVGGWPYGPRPQSTMCRNWMNTFTSFSYRAFKHSKSASFIIAAYCSPSPSPSPSRFNAALRSSIAYCGVSCSEASAPLGYVECSKSPTRTFAFSKRQATKIPQSTPDTRRQPIILSFILDLRPQIRTLITPPRRGRSLVRSSLSISRCSWSLA